MLNRKGHIMLNQLNGWQRIGAVLAVMWIAFVLGKGLIGYSALETGQGAFVRTIPGQVVVVQKATAAHCTQVDPEPAPPSGSSTSGLSLSSIFHRPYGDDVPSGFHCTINHFIAATPDLTRTLPDRHDFQFSRMFVTAFAIPALVWLLIWIAMATIRWVAKGFHSKPDKPTRQ
ncbi:MAG TPA: hypothetical protein VN679_11905 [Candidatus Acidoferrales bacterium]|nr:hypothetical protein [Candidatus Acidoferrales bacterium]